MSLTEPRQNATGSVSTGAVFTTVECVLSAPGVDASDSVRIPPPEATRRGGNKPVCDNNTGTAQLIAQVHSQVWSGQCNSAARNNAGLVQARQQPEQTFVQACSGQQNCVVQKGYPTKRKCIQARSAQHVLALYTGAVRTSITTRLAD